MNEILSAEKVREMVALANEAEDHGLYRNGYEGVAREKIERLAASHENLRAQVEEMNLDGPGGNHHVIELREDGWTIQHPLSCRPNLFDCPVNRAAEQMQQPKLPLGRYGCHVEDNTVIYVDAALEGGAA